MSGSVDFCPFFDQGDQATGQFSLTTNDRTSYPPGDYEIEITGTVSGFTNSASHTFNLKMIDPCLNTVLTISSIDD